MRIRQAPQHALRVVGIQQQGAQLVAIRVAPIHRVVQHQPPRRGAQRRRRDAAHAVVPAVGIARAGVMAVDRARRGGIQAVEQGDLHAGRNAVQDGEVPANALREQHPVLVRLAGRRQHHRRTPVPAARPQVLHRDRGQGHRRRVCAVEGRVGHVHAITQSRQARILAAGQALTGATDPGLRIAFAAAARCRLHHVAVYRRRRALDEFAALQAGMAEHRQPRLPDGAVDQLDTSVQRQRRGIEHGLRLPGVGGDGRQQGIGHLALEQGRNGSVPRGARRGTRCRPVRRARQRAHGDLEAALATAKAHGDALVAPGQPRRVVPRMVVHGTKRHLAAPQQTCRINWVVEHRLQPAHGVRDAGATRRRAWPRCTADVTVTCERLRERNTPARWRDRVSPRVPSRRPADRRRSRRRSMGPRATADPSPGRPRFAAGRHVRGGLAARPCVGARGAEVARAAQDRCAWPAGRRRRPKSSNSTLPPPPTCRRIV